MQSPNIQAERASYSRVRLDELRTRLADLVELKQYARLTVFAVGSYGRLEASKYSDLDLFFIHAGQTTDIPDPRTMSVRLFGKVIEIGDFMKFPKFSNDAEYLSVIHLEDILTNLGGRTDDHTNYFTARMLLLLEGSCLYGDDAFDDVIRKIVAAYFRDYPDHPLTFEPTFLINDICRFWKTMLLNYEHKRSVPPGPGAPEKKKTQQKVRNFKLKYSRMTTCYATIAALGSHAAPVTEEQTVELIRLTPYERLQSVAQRLPRLERAVDNVLTRYVAFLELTGLPTVEIEAHFADKKQRADMFQLANEYGNAMFALLHAIDATDARLNLLRTLVI